jgi:hypothetical protein
VVVQFLVIGREARGIERKCGLEVAAAEDVDVAVQASYLSLFGTRLPPEVASARLPQTVSGPPMSLGAPVWQRFNTHVDALERELQRVDAGPAGAQANVAALSELMTALQALLTQVEASIASVDADLAPPWLRAVPQPAPAK